MLPSLNPIQTKAVLIEIAGGTDTLEMLVTFHAEDPRDRLSVPELAGKYGIPRTTIQTRLAAARVRLRRCGLMPVAWERQLSNRPITAA